MSPISYLILRYKNCSLHVKLFSTYFFLIFLPVIFLTAFSWYRSSRIITEQSIEISRLYLQQTEHAVASELEKNAAFSSLLAQDNEIRTVLEKQDQNIGFSEEFDDMTDLQEMLANAGSLQAIYQIRLFVSDAFRFSRSRYFLYPLSDVSSEAWYRDLVTQNRIQTLLPPAAFRAPLAEPEQLLSVATAIRSMDDINTVLGVVCVDIPEDLILRILRQNNSSDQSACFLVDGNGNIVCRASTGYALSDEQITSLLAQTEERFGGSSGVDAFGNTVAGLSAPIYQGWRIFTIASFEHLLSPANELRNNMVFLTVTVSIIVFFLSYIYSRYSTRRVKVLAEQLRRIEAGDLTVRCVVDSEDEIGELQNRFNFMARRINLLVNEQYNLGKSLKEQELKALQAQINPHFLYNTLDLISWQAAANGDQKTVETVGMLARFYRLSLSNGSDFVPLRDEVEHIRLFVELANLSRERQVLLVTEIAPNLADYPVMKLILQPIVENSLFHGLFDLKSRAGIIRLTAERVGSYVQIRVADNGVGMEKSRITEILAKRSKPETAEKSGGYGIGNIMERLRIYYGDRYAFQMESATLSGTTVTIRIPYTDDDTPHIHAERTAPPPA